ncbi:MAG: ABC transporter ATP-binding protein [Thermodesulfovibrionia bacterium]|nr:ABC transporter ATP-binding protein [Thermodesulfovibrionia bacterium]
MVNTAIKASQLIKDYTSVRALDNVNLEVYQGECFGLLGPNGAGKTTLMKILLDLISPSSGLARIFNQPVKNEKIRERVGYLPERVKIYGFLKGSEFLDYQGKLYGMEHTKRNRRVEECLKVVGMYEDRLRKIGEYSKGMVQRIGLAQALLNEPELLLLDEPAAGLDPISNKEIRDILLRLKEAGVTVFINSHLLSEIEMICDRVAILHRGHLVKMGTKQELTTKGELIELKVEGINDLLLKKIREVSTQIQLEENLITLSPKDAKTITVIPEIVINQGGKLLSLTSRIESLEDIFYRLIKEEEEPIE